MICVPILYSIHSLLPLRKLEKTIYKKKKHNMHILILLLSWFSSYKLNILPIYLFISLNACVAFKLKLGRYTAYLEFIVEYLFQFQTANMTEVKHILSQPPVPKFDEKALPKARKQINKIDEKNGIRLVLCCGLHN